MQFARRLLIFSFALLIFFGSAGWVITSHLCSAEVTACEEENGYCCCGGENEVATIPPADKAVSEAGTCCISTNIYFSVPVYRIESLKNLQPNFSFVALPLVCFTSELFTENTISISRFRPPPGPLISGSDILQYTGLLLI